MVPDVAHLQPVMNGFIHYRVMECLPARATQNQPHLHPPLVIDVDKRLHRQSLEVGRDRGLDATVGGDKPIEK